MASSQEEAGRQAPEEAGPVGSPVVGFKMYQLLSKQLDSLNKEVAVLEAAIEATVAKLVDHSESRTLQDERDRLLQNLDDLRVQRSKLQHTLQSGCFARPRAHVCSLLLNRAASFPCCRMVCLQA
jgi:hypothetical protein